MEVKMKVANEYMITCPRCTKSRGIEGHYGSIPEVYLCHLCNLEFALSDLDLPLCCKNKGDSHDTRTEDGQDS